MYAKYKASISYDSKAMANIKSFCHRDTDRQTDGTKPIDAPEFFHRDMNITIYTQNTKIPCMRFEQTTDTLYFLDASALIPRKCFISPDTSVDLMSFFPKCLPWYLVVSATVTVHHSVALAFALKPSCTMIRNILTETKKKVWVRIQLIT